MSNFNLEGGSFLRFPIGITALALFTCSVVTSVETNDKSLGFALPSMVLTWSVYSLYLSMKNENSCSNPEA